MGQGRRRRVRESMQRGLCTGLPKTVGDCGDLGEKEKRALGQKGTGTDVQRKQHDLARGY